MATESRTWSYSEAASPCSWATGTAHSQQRRVLRPPRAIAVGDFNGDGIPDLAVVPAFDESVSVMFLGNGDGTFTQVGGNFGTIGGNTFTSNAIAAADFNGDGKLDLTVV